MSDIELKDSDYVLTDGGAWFTIDNISIRISSKNGIVVVSMYAANSEMEKPLATCHAYQDDALEVIEKEDDY